MKYVGTKENTNLLLFLNFLALIAMMVQHCSGQFGTKTVEHFSMALWQMNFRTDAHTPTTKNLLFSWTRQLAVCAGEAPHLLFK